MQPILLFTDDAGYTYIDTPEWPREATVSKFFLLEQSAKILSVNWPAQTFQINAKNGWALYEITGMHPKYVNSYVAKYVRGSKPKPYEPKERREGGGTSVFDYRETRERVARNKVGKL